MNIFENPSTQPFQQPDPDNATGNSGTPVPTADGRHWLAAYVKMHHERKTRDMLNAMGIECFLPVQEEVRRWSDRLKKMERILIPMMIFVRVNAAEQRQVIQLPGVIRYLVLRGEHRPAIIPDYQMNHFRFLLDNAEQTVTIEQELLVPGISVRVVKGPLQGLEGILLTVEGNSRIAVRIEQLGYATVEMHMGMVEINS